MAEKNFLTMSENGKSEYCCSVVKISELIPVDGSDFLAMTNVLGTQIVVRKDMVKEGDIMFYAANETALNQRFLSANNLYEIGCRSMNANAAEVNKHASNAIRLGNILTTVATDLLTAHTSQAQMIYKNARSIFTRAATYGGKDEAAFMEAVSQVSDYEADQIFE